MIFAPTILAGLILMIVIRLLAIYSIYKLISFIVKCFREPNFLALVKQKPLLPLFKLTLMLVLIGIGVFEYSHTSKSLQRTKAEMQVWNEKHNPVLQEKQQIAGLILPKGTKLESYEPDRDSFFRATFPHAFKFKNLDISWIQNPRKNSAQVKLVNPTVIDGFECEQGKPIFLNFDNTQTFVGDCSLTNSFIFKDINWKKGSIVDTSEKIVKIKGNAEFIIDQKPHNEFLNYSFQRDSEYEFFKDKSYKMLLRTDPGHPTKQDKYGAHSIQFNTFKNFNYRITNKETGEIIRGKTDALGKSEKIITDKPSIFYFDLSL